MPIPNFVFPNELDDDDESLSWSEEEDRPGTFDDDQASPSPNRLQTRWLSREAAIAAKANKMRIAWQTRSNNRTTLPATATMDHMLQTNESIPVSQAAAQDKVDTTLARPDRLLVKARSLDAATSSEKLRHCPDTGWICSRPPKPPVRQLSKESDASTADYGCYTKKPPIAADSV